MIDNLTEAIEKYKRFAECETESARVLRNVGNEKDAKYFEETAENDKKIVAWLTELQERREADRWTSVDEALPKKEGWYLVDRKERTSSIQYFFFSTVDHKPYWSGECKVYYWRPLPEPYESEAESLDNQRAVEDTEYCERHEPTYNPDDGSM